MKDNRLKNGYYSHIRGGGGILTDNVCMGVSFLFIVNTFLLQVLSLKVKYFLVIFSKRKPILCGWTT